MLSVVGSKQVGEIRALITNQGSWGSVPGFEQVCEH